MKLTSFIGQFLFLATGSLISVLFPVWLSVSFIPGIIISTAVLLFVFSCWLLFLFLWSDFIQEYRIKEFSTKVWGKTAFISEVYYEALKMNLFVITLRFKIKTRQSKNLVNRFYDRWTSPIPVFCHECAWVGKGKDATHHYKPTGEPGECEPAEYCPKCGKELL